MDVGVVGLGHWGSNHVRAVSAARDVDRVFVHDLSAGRMEKAASAHRAVPVADLDSFFDRCDAVIVATHASTHLALAEQALRRGCHLLVEKPLALSSPDVRRVAAQAQALDRILMVGHTFAYHPAVEALALLAAGGGLGAVQHIEGRRLNLGLYRSDCDVVWDLAPHDLSIFAAVLGGPPRSVLARAGRPLGAGVNDSTHLHLSYPGGVTGVISLSWRWPTKVRETTVVGTRGMAVFDDTDRAAPLKVYDMAVSLPRQGGDEPFTYRDGGMRTRSVSCLEPLSLEVEHFLSCVLTNSAPRTGAAEALDVVLALEAATTSLREGREVQLAELAASAPSTSRSVPAGTDA